jgi:uncharacterized protein involved in copper resistance
LIAAPTFAQQDQDKPAEAPKAQEKAPADKDKAVKPEADKAKPAGKTEEKSAPKSDARRMPQSDQEPGAQDAKRGNGGDEQRDKSAHYQFKGDAKTKLRSSYKNITTVNRSTRVTIVRQQVMPVEIRTQIEPVPVDVVSYLGPPPAGFVFGFVNGYCVVYDPNTFFVIEVIDLD